MTFKDVHDLMTISLCCKCDVCHRGHPEIKDLTSYDNYIEYNRVYVCNDCLKFYKALGVSIDELREF